MSYPKANTVMIKTKPSFKSATMNGPYIMLAGFILAMFGISDPDGQLSNDIANVLIILGSLAQAIGPIITYIGRKRASPDISLIRSKYVEVPVEKIPPARLK